MSNAKHAVYALFVMNANVAGFVTPTTAARMVQIGNKLAKTSENFLNVAMGAIAPPAARGTTDPLRFSRDAPPPNLVAFAVARATLDE